MNIAIIGAGIGGLTTALFLEKEGFSVKVYDQATQIKPIGAGIMLAHNAMQVYDKLDLKETISELGNPLSSMNIVTPLLGLISGLEMAYFDQKYNVQNIAIQRGCLQELLINKLTKKNIYLNKKLTKIKEGRQVLLSFSDGSEESFDLVIAADGINSVVRRALFPESTIRKAQQTCWRGIADFELPTQYSHQLNEAWGSGSRFGFVKLSSNQTYWYALKSDDASNQEEGLTEIFRDYDCVVSDIILKTSAEKIIKSNIEDLKPINSWVKENICLLGGAAHATTPNMGQGACQAIEDAYILSQCLSRDATDIALNRYESLRIKKAKKVVNMSWMIGKISHIDNLFISKARNFLLGLIPNRVNHNQSDDIFKLTRL